MHSTKHFFGMTPPLLISCQTSSFRNLDRRHNIGNNGKGTVRAAVCTALQVLTKLGHAKNDGAANAQFRGLLLREVFQ